MRKASNMFMMMPNLALSQTLHVYIYLKVAIKGI